MPDIFTGALIASSYNGFNITKFLENAIKYVGTWGNYIVILTGVVMLICGVYQIAKGFITGAGPRGGQTNWVIAIMLILVGGFFSFGGLNAVGHVAQGGQQTIDGMGKEEAAYGETDKMWNQRDTENITDAGSTEVTQ